MSLNCSCIELYGEVPNIILSFGDGFVYIEMVWSSYWLLYDYYRCLRLSYLTAINDLNGIKSQSDILPFSVDIYISNIYLLHFGSFMVLILPLGPLELRVRYGQHHLSVHRSVCLPVHLSTSSFVLRSPTVFICWFFKAGAIMNINFIEHGPITKILSVPIWYKSLSHILVAMRLRSTHFLKWYFVILMYLRINLLISAHKIHSVFVSIKYF